MRARFVDIDFADLEWRLGSWDDGSEVSHYDLMVKGKGIDKFEIPMKSSVNVDRLTLKNCRRFPEFYSLDRSEVVRWRSLVVKKSRISVMPMIDDTLESRSGDSEYISKYGSHVSVAKIISKLLSWR